MACYRISSLILVDRSRLIDYFVRRTAMRKTPTRTSIHRMLVCIVVALITISDCGISGTGLKSFGVVTGAIALASTDKGGAGYDAWLRYDALDEKSVYDKLPSVVAALDDSDVVRSAQEELVRGVRGMLGRTLRTGSRLPDENAVVLGKVSSITAVISAFE